MQKIRCCLIQHLKKIFADPKYVPYIGFRQVIWQQRPVTDTRRNKNDIALLKFISFGAYKVFRAAGISATEHFIKGMAVKLELCVGCGYILMRIHIRRLHFQLLIEGTDFQSQEMKKILDAWWVKTFAGSRKRLLQFSNLG